MTTFDYYFILVFATGILTGIAGNSIFLKWQHLRRKMAGAGAIRQFSRGRINPLTGKPFLTKSELRMVYPPAIPRRSDRVALPTVELPKHLSCVPLGDQMVLVHEDNRTLIIAERDDRDGAWGFKTPHELHWHGSYATMTDALRAAARDGFAPAN